MVLPLIARSMAAGTSRAALTSRVAGATTAPSGTIPRVLMKKPPKSMIATAKKSADIIQFPGNNNTRIPGQQKTNQLSVTKKRSDYSDNTQRLIKEIRQTNGDAVRSNKSENKCCEQSLGIQKDISETLKSMLDLQRNQVAANYENSIENKDTPAGMGGFLEARADDAKGFGKLIGDIIGVAFMLGVKPVIQLFNAGVKLMGDAIKVMSDAVGSFVKGVGDWVAGFGKWWDETFGGKAESSAQAANARRETVTNPENARLDSGQTRARDNIKIALEREGIKDPKAVSNIMAQVKGESGFVNMSEMSYRNTSNDRIRSVFGDKVKGLDDKSLDALKQDDEKFFNHVYGDIKSLGNKEEGDAYKYRGRGYIQLTGRANYERIGKLIGADLVKNPDLMNNPQVAARATAAYFKDKQNSGVDLKDINAVTKAVGPRNLAEAQKTRAVIADQYLQTNYAGVIGKTNTINNEAVKSTVPMKPVGAPANNNTTVVQQGGQGGPQKAPPVLVSSPDRGPSPMDQASQFRH